MCQSGSPQPPSNRAETAFWINKPMPTIAIVRYTSPGEDGATFMGYLASLRSPNHNPEQYSLWPVRKAIEPQFKLAAMVNEHGRREVAPKCGSYEVRFPDGR